MIVGAMLVQNTSWQRVEAALEDLRRVGLLTFAALQAVPVEELAEHLRTVGYFRVKARRLKNLLAMIHNEHAGSLERLFALPHQELRQQLLAVNGVGPETADSIVLYGARQPRFVIDAYTHRIFARHGWVDYGLNYHDLQAVFEDSLPADVQLFNEYHALLVRLGNQHCRSRPRCEGCPLQAYLPTTGICWPDG